MNNECFDLAIELLAKWNSAESELLSTTLINPNEKKLHNRELQHHRHKLAKLGETTIDEIVSMEQAVMQDRSGYNKWRWFA